MKMLKMPAVVQRLSRNGKVVLINPEVPAWVVTNEIGEAIATLFDGNHTRNEIVAIAVEALGEAQRKNIERIVDYISASKLFCEPTPIDNEQQPLANVHISLTNKCNLRCRYCYAAERKETAAKQLGLEEYYQLIDDIRQINPNVGFTLTGGEPMLSPLFFELASKIRERGNMLMILTNGTLLTDQLCRKLQPFEPLVTISIDGADAESHSRTRGNNYERVLEAIGLLEKYEIDYTLSMTVTRINKEQVQPLAQRYGRRLSFAPLFPVSDDAQDALSITGEEYYEVLKGAAGVNPLSYCEETLQGAMEKPNVICAIASGEFSVSPSGDVYPCQLLHMPQYKCGNVRENTIAEIYHNSERMRELRRLTVNKIERCRECAIKYICGGACRARNHYETGDLAKVGEFCRYEFNAFLDGITLRASTEL